jgi:hypothetical protein
MAGKVKGLGDEGMVEFENLESYSGRTSFDSPRNDIKIREVSSRAK